MPSSRIGLRLGFGLALAVWLVAAGLIGAAIVTASGARAQSLLPPAGESPLVEPGGLSGGGWRWRRTRHHRWHHRRRHRR